MTKKVGIVLLTILVIALGIGGGFYLKDNLNHDTTDKTQEKETSNEDNGSLDDIKDNSQDDTSQDSKIVVIYFSATGTTKRVASSLSEQLQSDLIEIEPKEKYSSSDLNYNDTNSRVSQEHNNSTSRPEIANKIEIDKYTTVYLGYPIWWNDAPRIIYSFLDSYDLSNKKLYLFSTSASSGIGGSVNNIKSYQKSLNVLGSKRFSSSFKDSDIEDFIKNNK